jgi:hypothetical protein
MSYDVNDVAVAGSRKLTQLDFIANNLANISTNGFKSEHLYYAIKGREAQEGARSDLGRTSTFVDFTQGTVQRTGNPLDAAIEGDGFFAPALANLPGTTYAPHPRYRWLSVADRHVTPEFVGLAPGFVGLYQVNFAVPGDLEPGDYIVRVESGECTGISPIGFGSCVGGEVPRATAASNPVLIAVGQ